MSRIRELEARRRILLERCEVQRAALGARCADLNPLAFLRPGPGSGRGPLRHPLAWAGTLAALLFLGRTREVLSIAGRAAQLLRAVSQLRGPRAEGPDSRRA